MIALLAAAVSQGVAAYYVIRVHSSFNTVLGPSQSKPALDAMVDWQVLFNDLSRSQYWENAANVTCVVGALALLVWFNLNGRTWGRPSLRVFTLFALVCTVAAVGIRLYIRSASNRYEADMIKRFSDSLFPQFGAAVLTFQKFAPLLTLGYAAGVGACIFLFLFVGSVARQ